MRTRLGEHHDNVCPLGGQNPWYLELHTSSARNQAAPELLRLSYAPPRPSLHAARQVV